VDVEVSGVWVDVVVELILVTFVAAWVFVGFVCPETSVILALSVFFIDSFSCQKYNFLIVLHYTVAKLY